MSKLKSRVSGKVIEVGWEPGTTLATQNYAVIKVKLSSTRDKDLAEKQLKQLTKKILGKKVVIFQE